MGETPRTYSFNAYGRSHQCCCTGSVGVAVMFVNVVSWVGSPCAGEEGRNQEIASTAEGESAADRESGERP